MEIKDQATLQQYIDNTPDSYLMPLLAALYLTDNEYQSAIDLCRKDLTIHPYSALAHYIWALTAEAMDDIDQAVAQYQATVQADVYFLQAYYKLIEYSQGYLSPQQLKFYYEQVCRLNPLDMEIAAKLAAMPADLDMLAEQMKVKPQRSSKAKPPVVPEPEPAQITSEPPTASGPPPESAPPSEKPVVEADLTHGADHLTKFFDSVKKAKEPVENQPVAEPKIPEEEAHLGPIEMPEPETEPTINLEEPELAGPAAVAAPEMAETSSISDFFSRLREKPLEEVQKENWMAEHAMSAGQPEASAPASAKSPTAAEPTAETPATAPAEPSTEILESKIENLLKPEPENKPAETAPEVPTPEEPIDVEKAPIETAGVQSEPAKPKKRSSRSTKKTGGANSNITFPIPTWTLVDVLTKQKLFEQALSILDIIETKAKSEGDLTKIQEKRSEIIKLMAEEQAGEA